MPTIILTTLSILLLAAHALRFGETGMTLALLGCAALVWTRRTWVRLACIPLLAWAVVTWAQTLTTLLRFRMAADLPWIRLAVILSLIMGAAVYCMLALTTGPGQRFFARGKTHDPARAAVFVLTAALLLVLREQTPIALLLADRFFPGLGPLEIFGLALYAVWVAGRLLDPKTQAPTRRLIWLVFSQVFFFQLFLGLAGIEQFLMTGKLHIPVPALILAGPLFRGEGFFMPILFGSTLLLVGPAWCSHLCYIGAWDNVMAMKKRPHPLPGWTPALRWTILVLVVLTALGLRVLSVPMTYAVILAVSFGLAGVGIMVFISRKMGVMVHCTTLCPIGLVGNYLGKLAPWRIRIADSCTRCMACLPACRYNALDLKALKQGKPHITCTLCGDCVSACKHGALTFSAPLLTPTRARTLFVITVTMLHTVFLGIARI
jgi:NAD-dependent dihydropyrimidine dehydrogenase PreA subunit